MTLMRGAARKIIDRNIADLIRSGKSRKWAIARALREANKSLRRRDINVQQEPKKSGDQSTA